MDPLMIEDGYWINIKFLLVVSVMDLINYNILIN